ncbi:olfactory receptor 4B13-like [Mixophyes fleayi]|uniref:olfactory receptor 4B13-like n=1 Tax=Mixophyes fleayi TaxID=3061075 RepID=UPI003F4DBA48
MSLLEYEADMKMENLSRISTSFVFVGLLEMEKYRYLYSVLSLNLYMMPMLLCCLIVYVIWAEESLHQPMYIFICNLLLNGVYGNTVIFPQFIIDLMLGSSTISLPGCLTQIFCVQSYFTIDLFTFTTMAYDRYLAVGHPLRYPSMMTNRKALIYIFLIWVAAFIFVLIPVITTANLQFCGVNINNIYCDNMSLVRLACGDSSINNIFRLIGTFIIALLTLPIITYCYISTLLICLKISRSTSLKAFHTLIVGTAMGTIFAPSFANLIMGSWEQRYIYNPNPYSENIALYKRIQDPYPSPDLQSPRDRSDSTKKAKNNHQSPGTGNCLQLQIAEDSSS